MHVGLLVGIQGLPVIKEAISALEVSLKHNFRIIPSLYGVQMYSSHILLKRHKRVELSRALTWQCFGNWYPE